MVYVTRYIYMFFKKYGLKNLKVLVAKRKSSLLVLLAFSPLQPSGSSIYSRPCVCVGGLIL